MALLNSISRFKNSTIIAIWANGKRGEIVPTEHNTYIFVGVKDDEDGRMIKDLPEYGIEDSPVLAYGFVSYWLRYRKRSTKRAERLDLFKPEVKTPKEIFDTYIEARKSWFVDMMNNRPDSWRYPDLEKLFYEQNLTVEGEEDLIAKSEPLLDYLDEEDKQEFIDVMANFLGYVESVVKPYQKIQEDNDGPEIELSPEEELFEKYKDSIESVFLETYRYCDQEYMTYPNVKEAFRLCIDPNEPTQVPVFIEACIKKKCVRKNSGLQPDKVVKALLGLGVMSFENDRQLKNFREAVGRKFKRLKDSEMTEAENIIYGSVCNKLNRPIEGTLIEK